MLLRIFLFGVFSALLFASLNNRPRNHSLPRSVEEIGSAFADEYIAPPGKFVNLSYGSVHYRLDVPQDFADTVVLVHGLNDNVNHWNWLREDLVKLKYRVLVFDNYGNGWSEAPDAFYTEHLYTSQISELLFALNISYPVHFVGQSMGGAISSKYSSLYPSRVKSLTVMGPPGMSANTPFLAKFVGIPLISDFINMFLTPSILLGRVAKAYTDPKYAKVKEYALRMLSYQLKHNKDILRVLSRILQDFPLHSMAPVYEKLDNYQFPVHIIWGSDDATVPVESAHLIKAAIKRAKLTIFQSLGHTGYMQSPEVVNPSIIEFIQMSRSR